MSLPKEGWAPHPLATSLSHLTTEGTTRVGQTSPPHTAKDCTPAMAPRQRHLWKASHKPQTPPWMLVGQRHIWSRNLSTPLPLDILGSLGSDIPLLPGVKIFNRVTFVVMKSAILPKCGWSRCSCYFSWGSSPLLEKEAGMILHTKKPA